jgi:membrane fusion protein, epimerase transport system
LRVKEGDRVNAGDVLIVLDETQAQAEYDVLSQQYMVLRATEARLLAELDHRTSLAMPDDLKARPDDTYIMSVWNGQVSQFDSRRAALEGQRSVIREKINQLVADRWCRSAGEGVHRPDFIGPCRIQGHRAAG